jgi:anti-sigma factor RsiW
MMTCRELVELLCDFIDGELTAEQRRHIEEHLGDCPPCVIYVETYRLTITMSRKLPTGPLPPQLAERLRAVMDAHRKGHLPQPGPQDNAAQP